MDALSECARLSARRLPQDLRKQCGKGDPKHGIEYGTTFEDLPEDWKCPGCRQGKEKFNKA